MEENRQELVSPLVTTGDYPQDSQAVQPGENDGRRGGGLGALEPSNLDGGGVAASSVGNGGEESKSGSLSVEVTGKRKRGRPRKYNVADDVYPLSLALRPPTILSPASSEKRGRGRPRGSGKGKLLGPRGRRFSPHVLTVETGEDLYSKIHSLAERCSEAVCILSARGFISKVVLTQPSSPGGVLSFEGRFQILSLSGSFTYTDVGGAHGKQGMINVLLAKHDGQVFGGDVAGSLISAGPIQLVILSFKQDISQAIKTRQPLEPTTAASVLGCSTLANIPVQIGEHTEGDENCAPLKSALLEPHGREASNTENVDPGFQNFEGQNILQSSAPISEQRKPPQTKFGVFQP